ncbi:MAG: PqqD family protein [Clostridia bacterium]|nr:PqqD family protein [Clostridia bacterium]
MKIREGFMLREVVRDHVVVPVGKASTVLNGIIRLNNSGVLLWGLLQDGTDEKSLVEKLKEEYGIFEEQAARDVGVFLDTLKKVGCLEE